MASITIPGDSSFWMIYHAPGTDSGDEPFVDCEDVTFEIWTTEAQALSRAEQIANDEGAGEYRTCVFKVDPVGYVEKISRVEFTPLGKGQTKPLVKSAVAAPKRRRMVLTDD